jgi:hypothetical protein
VPSQSIPPTIAPTNVDSSMTTTTESSATTTTSTSSTLTRSVCSLICISSSLSLFYFLLKCFFLHSYVLFIIHFFCHPPSSLQVSVIRPSASPKTITSTKHNHKLSLHSKKSSEHQTTSRSISDHSKEFSKPLSCSTLSHSLLL